MPEPAFDNFKYPAQTGVENIYLFSPGQIRSRGKGQQTGVADV